MGRDAQGGRRWVGRESDKVITATLSQFSVETSRQSMFSRAQMKDTAQTQLVADTGWHRLLSRPISCCSRHCICLQIDSTFYSTQWWMIASITACWTLCASLRSSTLNYRLKYSTLSLNGAVFILILRGISAKPSCLSGLVPNPSLCGTRCIVSPVIPRTILFVLLLFSVVALVCQACVRCWLRIRRSGFHSISTGTVSWRSCRCWPTRSALSPDSMPST